MTTATLLKTTLTIIDTETVFYVKNNQAPIATQPEIIFHNLLFRNVCLEIFRLIFLIFKHILIPLFEYLLNRGKNHPNPRVRPRNSQIDDHEIEEVKDSKLQHEH